MSSNDSFLYRMRKGDSDDPYIEYEQTDKVRNNRIILKEIPDKFQGLVISKSDGTVLNYSDNGFPDSDTVIIDWKNSELLFHDIIDGENITVSFYGKGNIYVPANRVSTNVDANGNVIETLEGLTNGMIEVRDNVIQTNDTAEINEQARQDNETVRQQQEDNRQQNTLEALDRVDAVVEETTYIETYNSSTQYKKNNIVNFNGSSFIAKQDTQGNDPIEDQNTAYWAVISRKGADGNGTVHVYKDTFVAIEGQTIFTLNHLYDQYQNRTSVIVGGVPQRTPENYEEATNETIVLNDGVAAGTIVEVKYYGQALPLQSDIQTTVDNHTDEINKFNNQSIYAEKFTASENQTVFTLQTSYDQLQDKIEVYVDGVPQDSGENYIESANNQITLSEGVPAGTEVRVKYFGKRLPIATDVEATLNTHSSELSNHSIDIQNIIKNGTSPLFHGGKGDGTDETDILNLCIESLGDEGGVVVIPYGYTFMVRGWASDSEPDFPTAGVKLKSNITIFMHGATLKVIPNDKDHYTCLNVSNCDNVKVYGGTLVGDRDSHTNSPTYGDFGDQWGYGVAVVGSSNVVIEDVTAKDFTGDGFYIGADSTGLLSANVTINKCLAHNNRRNGASITGLYGGKILNNVFRETNGWLPESGLDIEPNPGRVVDGVILQGNHFLGNNAHGLLMASLQDATRSAKNCIVDGNFARYNKASGFYFNKADKNTYVNNQSFENEENGFVWMESHYNSIVGNKSLNNKRHGFMLGYCESNEITSNFANGNSQEADVTYDQFSLFSSHKNNIQNNTARHEDLTIKAQYGMYITSDCDNNLVMNNDLAASGFYAGLNNASTTTNKGSGNRGNDYTSWSTEDFI